MKQQRALFILELTVRLID